MQLPASYDHKQYEGDIYKLWEASGVFTPKMVGEPYTIILPPPNANARLKPGTFMKNIWPNRGNRGSITHVKNCIPRFGIL